MKFFRVKLRPRPRSLARRSNQVKEFRSLVDVYAVKSVVFYFVSFLPVLFGGVLLLFLLLALAPAPCLKVCSFCSFCWLLLLLLLVVLLLQLLLLLLLLLFVIWLLLLYLYSCYLLFNVFFLISRALNLYSNPPCGNRTHVQPLRVLNMGRPTN